MRLLGSIIYYSLAAKLFFRTADSAYKGPYVSDVIRRAGIKPGERRPPAV